MNSIYSPNDVLYTSLLLGNTNDETTVGSREDEPFNFF